MLFRLPRNQQFWLSIALHDTDLASGDFSKELEDCQAAVQRNSNRNPNIQLEVAGIAPDQRMILQHLAGMSNSTAEKATANANWLRWMMVSRINFSRDEVHPHVVQNVRNTVRNLKIPLQVDVENFIQGALSGEKKDPDNAFFPMMLAIGLFDAKKDAEALQAIHRASLKHDWNDYSIDETRGVLLIDELANGRQSAILRKMQTGMLLLPHLGYFKPLSRLVRSYASDFEDKGKVETGIRLRKEMATCGVLMRNKAGQPAANLTGMAIISIMFARGKEKDDLGSDRGLAEANFKYCDWLKSRGELAQSEWANSQITAYFVDWQILHDGEKKCADGLVDLDSLSKLWRSNMTLLSSVFWLGLVVGTSFFLAKQKTRLAKGSEISILIGILAAGALLSFRASRWIEIQLYLNYLTTTLYYESQPPSWDSVVYKGISSHIATFLGYGTVPICILLAIACIGFFLERHNEKSIHGSFLKHLPKWGLTVTLSLFWLYGLTLIDVGNKENRMRVSLDQRFIHTGRYFASLTGRIWK